MPSQPPFTDSFTTFGDLLKYLRRRERLTQLELSITVGYSEAQIGRLEKNQRRPDLATVKALFIPALHLEDTPALSTRLLELAASAHQEAAPAPGLTPYKGLMYFDEADADLFFGREGLTARLVERVTAVALDAPLRFLAVVGASGSGKSSLVRAGLAVTLQQAGWEVRTFTPTADPVPALEAQLNAKPATATAARVLILVDQFEETFTLCHHETARLAFIERLLALAQPGAGRTVVVIALRADFYSHCAQYPNLRQALAAEQEYIGQMTTTELRRAIEEPAQRGGWEFEAGLVEVLLQDIGAHGPGEPEPGALPLLSHALLATWERRRGRMFTLAGYRASGGVRGAIAETAESVFTDQLNQAQQHIARDVFLRLTELGEGTEDTRRRAGLHELARQAEEAPQLRGVLNTLAEARLITLNEDSAEVAHEALIREWQRLHEWLALDREGLRLHRHLTETAREWEALGRDAGAVYRGARLAQAREWALTNAERLNDSERAFVAASVEQEQHDIHEREAQRQRELEAAQQLAQEQARRAEEQAQAAKQLRRRAVFLAGAFGLAIFLAGAAIFFGRQAAANAADAKAEQQVAFARELAASSVSNLSVDPERSILLALQALNINLPAGQPVLTEAQDALHRSIQSSRGVATLSEHEASLWTVAVSRDGARLATVGMDGTTKIWDLATKQVLMTLATHVTDNLVGVGAAFSADGTQLLTISGGNSATLWDVSTGQALFVLAGHAGLITSVAISPDSKLLATASDDTMVKLWDSATGQEVKTLVGHEGDALVMAFGADGKRLFAGSAGDGYVIAWEVATGEELFRFDGQGNVTGVESIAASPDGKRLATGEFDTTVKVWDYATGSLLFTLFGHSSQVVSVGFSPDGKYLASASEDGTARLWDAATGKPLLTLFGHTSGVLSLAFSPDGNRLYTASRDGTAKVWDISPTAGSDWLNLAGHTNRVAAVTYSPDGTQLVTWSYDGTVKIWDAASGRELQTLQRAESSGSGNFSGGNAAYSPDGRRLAFVSGSTAIIVDAVSGAELFSLPGLAEPAIAVRFSPDGALVALAGTFGAVQICDSADGKVLVEFAAASDILQIAFSPDSRRLASANSDGANVWDVKTGQHLLTFAGHGAGVRVSGVAFSPDGERLASAGNDATVRVWDAQTGQEIFVLTGHTGAAFGVAFRADGQSLATSSVDRTIKVWRLPGLGETLEEPLTLYGHSAAVYSVAFSPDGSRLATSGRDPLVRVYALDIKDLVAMAQARLTRTLTVEECQKFLHTPVCPSATP